MDSADIRTLYEYDRWANARVLDAVAKLSKDQFTKDMGSSMRSIRDTLVHVLSGERVWLARWNGSSPRTMMDPKSLPTVEALRAAWVELEREFVAFLGPLTDDRLRGVLAYKTTEGKPYAQPLWQQMAHLANHSTYHRGQVTTMLRQLGAAPIGTDLITFFREQNSSAERG